MSELGQLSTAIEKLYAAALNSALWREALVAVEQFTGSTGAVVDLIPVERGVQPRTFSGSFSQEDCADYALNYQSICPRIAFAARHPNVATQFDRLVFSEAEMDRDPVYEWLGKHGLRYYIGGVGGRTRLYDSFFSLQRSRRQGHVETKDIQRFELVRPHIAQALVVADTLGTLSAHRRFSDALLDALPQAVFGLGHDGVLLFTNLSAEQLLARNTCLNVSGNRLTTCDPSQQSDLERWLATAFVLSSTECAGRFLIRSRSGQPFAARAIQLPTGQFEVLIHPSVLVIVNDPQVVSKLDEDSLRELYGLTQCETRVAEALLQGHSLQSASHMIGSSVETIRCHLKAVFRKIGVSRQQDLVRILAELEMTSITYPVCSSQSAGADEPGLAE